MLANNRSSNTQNVHASANETPLMSAVKSENFQLVQLLIERGANLDAADEFGDTSLMMAAEKGNLSLINLLIGHGATIDITNILGETAATMAKINGHDEILQLLDKPQPDSYYLASHDLPKMHAGFGSFSTIIELLANHLN